MTTTAQRTTTDRLRAMMERHNLNQSQMGRFLGISQGTVGNWMAGTRRPNKVVTRMIDMLEQIEVFHPTLFRTLLSQGAIK